MIRSELPSPSPSDHVHACQMMTEVHTVSMVAKNKYSGKAGGLPHPTRGGTKVRRPFTRVTMRVPWVSLFLRDPGESSCNGLAFEVVDEHQHELFQCSRFLE